MVELKQLGHKMLDFYVYMDKKRPEKRAREHAYEKLAFRMKRKEAHFRNMDSRDEVIRAIGCLKKMIRKRREKDAWLEESKDKSVYADPEVVRQALKGLNNFAAT